MTKKRIGRPTKMTQSTVNKLEEAFAFGCTDAEACLYADISKQCLYNYQEKDPGFVDRKEALKQRPVMLARKSVIDGLTKDPSLALKFLERKKKDEFSPKHIVDVRDPIKDMSPDQMREVVRERLARASKEQLAQLGIMDVEPVDADETPDPALPNG